MSNVNSSLKKNARFRGNCCYCRGRIFVNDWIVSVDNRWGHDDCHSDYELRLADAWIAQHLKTIVEDGDTEPWHEDQCCG